MRIELLGTESLGVRGLSCVVEVDDRKIVIDPGVALGYRRHGLLPHPLQVAVGEVVREKIMRAVSDATDIVFSHFHGDHVPLVDANPFQIHAATIAELCHHRPQFWAKGPRGLSQHMLHRVQSLRAALHDELRSAEGYSDGLLSFSLPVPHGERGEHGGMVMMTRIEDGNEVFVHASDIQLLNSDAVSAILAWHPTIVLASGPPLYLPHLTREQRRVAWHNALRLARDVHILILDHHLLRSERGLRWLDSLASIAEVRYGYRDRHGHGHGHKYRPHRVISAADFMGMDRTLLEAWRQRLYAEMPVPEGWHEAYARGEVDTGVYREWACSRCHRGVLEYRKSVCAYFTG